MWEGAGLNLIWSLSNYYDFQITLIAENLSLLYSWEFVSISFTFFHAREQSPLKNGSLFDLLLLYSCTAFSEDCGSSKIAVIPTGVRRWKRIIFGKMYRDCTAESIEIQEIKQFVAINWFTRTSRFPFLSSEKLHLIKKRRWMYLVKLVKQVQ